MALFAIEKDGLYNAVPVIMHGDGIFVIKENLRLIHRS